MRRLAEIRPSRRGRHGRTSGRGEEMELGLIGANASASLNPQSCQPRGQHYVVSPCPFLFRGTSRVNPWVLHPTLYLPSCSRSAVGFAELVRENIGSQRRMAVEPHVASPTDSAARASAARAREECGSWPARIIQCSPGRTQRSGRLDLGGVPVRSPRQPRSSLPRTGLSRRYAS